MSEYTCIYFFRKRKKDSYLFLDDVLAYIRNSFLFQTNTIDEMKARTKMKTLLLLGVLLFGFTVSAQSQKVSLDFKNERVEKVLASIKSQTGMSLVFSDQLVDVNHG